jgi:hypothetical protein
VKTGKPQEHANELISGRQRASSERRSHACRKVVRILDTAYMQVSLGERNFNARLAKPTVNFLMQITFHLQPVVHIRYPDAQLKIERTVPETPEQNPQLETRGR